MLPKRLPKSSLWATLGLQIEPKCKKLGYQKIHEKSHSEKQTKYAKMTSKMISKMESKMISNMT